MNNQVACPSANRTSAFVNRLNDAIARHRDAVALVHDETSFTYGQLDELANQVANCLSEMNPASGQRIGLCLDRSILAIAAMIGVMRSGSAFVPLDPEYPADRLRYMVEDANVQVILCDEPYASLFASQATLAAPKLIGPTHPSLLAASKSTVERETREETLAYIMYTSGSTGNPKGVQIEHRALATYCEADIDIYKLTQDDRTLQFSTLNFDIAIEEIFPPLLVGSAVVIRPRERSDEENELSAIIRRFQITALHCATAYWHEWVDLITASRDRVPESLRMVLATGEKVSPPHYQRWLSLCDHNILWCNAYGPTETTVTATVFIPPIGWDGESMPIGKPLLGYTAFILDANDKPLGVGETGDLYIGGPALAKGYLNLPEKTAAVFRTVNLPDTNRDWTSQRIYKTGDLARWLESGDIEYAGRIDHQIKLGSYRIEPGEIEYHMSTHPDVLEALVIHDEVDGKKSLIAYLAVGSKRVSAADIAGYLRDRLPSYMVPSRYCFCESFPKTINGKIDRKRLPSADTSEVPRVDAIDAPRNELETMLVELWKSVLGVHQIGVHDDFFAIGGSSLLVTRVIAGIRRHYDLAIPVRDFFANPTVASIAQLLAVRLKSPDIVVDSDSMSSAIRQRLPHIDAFYFPSGSHELFAVRYMPPEGSLRDTKHGVLICNADGHEYARSHRNLQQLAIQLAGHGLEVLRFDYSGCGNSTGGCREGSVQNWLNEINDAAEMFRKRAGLEKLSILGVRFGATLAMRAHAHDVAKTILWDPVFCGKQYVDLLDGFQYETLNNVRHYLKPRQTAIAQTYAIELPTEKRRSYRSLRLPSDSNSFIDQSVTILASRDYLTHEGIRLDRHKTRIIETTDQIYWHDPSYTQSAFSAPEITGHIVRLLQERSS